MTNTKSEELAHLRAQQEHLRERLREFDREIAEKDQRLSAIRGDLLVIARAQKVMMGLRELA